MLPHPPLSPHPKDQKAAVLKAQPSHPSPAVSLPHQNSLFLSKFDRDGIGYAQPQPPAKSSCPLAPALASGRSSSISCEISVTGRINSICDRDTYSASSYLPR